MAVLSSVNSSGLVPKKLEPAESADSVLPGLLKTKMPAPTPQIPLQQTGPGPVPIQPQTPPVPGQEAGTFGLTPPTEGPIVHGPTNPTPQTPGGDREGTMSNGDGAFGGLARRAPAPTPAGQSPAAPAFNPLGTSTYMQQFNPQNTIRATRITGGDNPTADTRAVDAARDAVGTGTDRNKIAQDLLSQLVESTNPAFENEMRNVNKMAAAGGRLGAGMTTTRLGDVASNRQQFITDSARQLASEAASASMGDRLNAFDALGSNEGRRFGQGVTSRDELRGERQYENTMARDARSDEIEKMLLEDRQLNSSFNRDQDRLDLIGRYGFGGNDPSGTLMQASANKSQQAGGGGDLLAELLYNQGSR